MGWIKKTFQNPKIGSAQVEFSTDSLDVSMKLKTTKENFIEKSNEASKAAIDIINMLGIKEAKKFLGGEAFNEFMRQVRDLTSGIIMRASEAFSSNMQNDVEMEIRFKENGEMVSYLDGKLMQIQKSPKKDVRQVLAAMRDDILH